MASECESDCDSERLPLLEALTGSGRVSMMENDRNGEVDLKLSLSAEQPLLQMRYEQKHEGILI